MEGWLGVEGGAIFSPTEQQGVQQQEVGVVRRGCGEGGTLFLRLDKELMKKSHPAQLFSNAASRLLWFGSHVLPSSLKRQYNIYTHVIIEKKNN